MDQILPMEDEESGDELRIINASFADPYLLILREDSSVKILKASGDGELEDVEATGLSSTKWLSASLFKSATFTEVFAFLLTPEGGLHVFAMSQMEKPCYVAEALCFLPPLLTVDYMPRRSAAKATITEILTADLGDATTKLPHLIVCCDIGFADAPAANRQVGANIQRRSGHLQSLPLPSSFILRSLDEEPKMGQAVSATCSAIHGRISR